MRFKTKNSNISFCFSNIPCKQWCDDSSALTEFTPLWKTSVKLQFFAKNSKHLVGTSGDDSSALIEFTPLCQITPCNLKKEIWLAVYSRSNLIGVTYIHLSLTHCLTDSLTNWPVHNIPDAPTKRYFFTKK